MDKHKKKKKRRENPQDWVLKDNTFKELVRILEMMTKREFEKDNGW